MRFPYACVPDVVRPEWLHQQHDPRLAAPAEDPACYFL